MISFAGVPQFTPESPTPDLDTYAIGNPERSNLSGDAGTRSSVDPYVKSPDIDAPLPINSCRLSNCRSRPRNAYDLKVDPSDNYKRVLSHD